MSACPSVCLYFCLSVFFVTLSVCALAYMLFCICENTGADKPCDKRTTGFTTYTDNFRIVNVLEEVHHLLFPGRGVFYVSGISLQEYRAAVKGERNLNFICVHCRRSIPRLEPDEELEVNPKFQFAYHLIICSYGIFSYLPI